MTTTTNTTAVKLFHESIGRQVEAMGGILLIDSVMSRKTGVLKDGSKAPYLHLAAMKDGAPEVDLHPQKALELIKKGSTGAYKILAALVTDSGPSATSPAKAETKKDATLRIYREEFAAGKRRKDIIIRMRTELGLSAPGANTYYHNVKSGMWK